jgi:alkane 1-monooxygenase
MKTSTWNYFFCLLPSFFTLFGNLAGGVWSASNAVFSLVFMVLVDFILPQNKTNQNSDKSELPNLILFLGFLFQMLCVGTLLFGIQTGILKGSTITWAAVSTGLNSGLLGITSAHELIHRKGLFFKTTGILNLMSCLYAHFYVEHRKVHHAFVGTTLDPATSRKGESVYAFFLRTIPLQWVSALKIEMARLKRVKAFPLGWRNFVLNTFYLQMAFLAGLYFWGNWDLLYAFLIQAFIGFLLLEYVNYIEHYGLIRKPGEKVMAHHAWQSDSVTSRFTLFELSRHSHHHMDARVEFHALHHQPSPYHLPFGYYGMFYIALIPPLWFKVMDHRIP